MLVQMEKEKVAKAEESINLLRATMQVRAGAATRCDGWCGFSHCQAQKEAEVASINAQKFANVQIIHAQMIIKGGLIVLSYFILYLYSHIAEKEAEKRTKEIETEIEVMRSKAATDSHYYEVTKTAEVSVMCNSALLILCILMVTLPLLLGE